jgi:hypothetical protein
MDARKRVAEGMTVYTRDGGKLGKVVAVDDAGLFVEKDFFFSKEYAFRYDDVAEIRDDGVHLRLDRTAISRALVGDHRGLARSEPDGASEERAEAATSDARPAGDRAPVERGGTGPGNAAGVHPAVGERVEGRVIPMVGEGIAPMLVEEEVLVEEPGPDRGERRAPGRRDGGEHD